MASFFNKLLKILFYFIPAIFICSDQKLKVVSQKLDERTIIQLFSFTLVLQSLILERRQI